MARLKQLLKEKNVKLHKSYQSQSIINVPTTTTPSSSAAVAVARVKKIDHNQYILAGIGDDAAISHIPPLQQLESSSPTPTPSPYLVQTIDYFRAMISDSYLFGQIAAVHALSDLHAMNATPFNALALVTIPYGIEQMVEDELLHLLAGARSIFDEENCILVGGHTSEGSETALGFSLTGYLYPHLSYQPILRKGPLPVKQVLLLTKGLGTGVILAGAMPHRNLVSGYNISPCYQSMLQSNGPAAKILAKYGCTACTDVTGFGLLGHLVEMINYQGDHSNDYDLSDPRNVNNSLANLEINDCIPCQQIIQQDLLSKPPSIVRLFLNQLPLLPGAQKCSEQGVKSSLYEMNYRSAQWIINLEDNQIQQHSLYPLLFDPQTSGGLLAAVPSNVAEIVREELQQAGYTQTNIIGDVLEEYQDILRHPSTAQDQHPWTVSMMRRVFLT
jgi:selenide, water dikinase